MKLDKGIVTRVDDWFDGRIQISPGVEKAVGYDIYNEKKYTDNACKPIKSWRNLTADELEVVMNHKENYHYNSVVSIHSIPDHIAENFEKLNLKKVASRPEALEIIKENSSVMSEISSGLDTCFGGYSFKGKVTFHNLSVTPPGLETLSSYFISNDSGPMQYLGLHLDRSTDFSLENSSESRNRICLNLSVDDRELIFINLSIIQLFEKLKGTPDFDKVNLDNVSEYFLSYFPNYPVLKVKIRPYEFYIAPTDNCIHDGSTLNRAGNDVAMSFLGYFNHKIEVSSLVSH